MVSTEHLMIFFKQRTTATNWQVYHDDGSDWRVFEGLNTSDGGSTNVTAMGIPTKYGIPLNGGGYSISTGGRDTLAYCWSEVPGFSAMGSYEGDGSTDGPMINCGFRPRYVLLKEYSVGGLDWVVIDTERDPANPTDGRMTPNSQGAEWVNAENNVDVVANGFKLRTSHNAYNGGGLKYIHMAFADTASFAQAYLRFSI